MKFYKLKWLFIDGGLQNEKKSQHPEGAPLIILAMSTHDD